MLDEEHQYRGWTITIEGYESNALKEEIEADSDYPLDNNLFYDYCVYREEPEEAISFSEFSDKEAAFDDAKITIDQFIEEEEKLELKCKCGSTKFHRVRIYEEVWDLISNQPEAWANEGYKSWEEYNEDYDGNGDKFIPLNESCIDHDTSKPNDYTGCRRGVFCVECGEPANDKVRLAINIVDAENEFEYITGDKTRPGRLERDGIEICYDTYLEY